MYDDFLRINPTFEARIDALTSGMLTPDTKALALWAMGRDRYYTTSGLYTAVERFAGGMLPITRNAIWEYCYGTPHKDSEGSLYSIGAVVKDLTVDTGSDSVLAYGKTDAGADFGDALAALECMAVNRLDSSLQRPRFVSMLRALGAANKDINGKHRRGYAVYKTIKLLAENPDNDFKALDVSEITELNRSVTSCVLNNLGRSGVIYYYSPHRDVGGKTQSGWSVLRVKEKILDVDFDEVYERAKNERKFYSKDYLTRVIEYCKEHFDNEIERHDIARITKIHVSNVSSCVTILRAFGYLEGELKASSARCNEHTINLWQDVFADVERVASEVKVYPELNRALNDYSDESLRLRHVRRWMDIYEAERTQHGPKHGKIAAQKVLENLTRKDMKLSAVVEEAQRQGILISRYGIASILTRLKRSGKVVSDKRGYYRRA